MLKLLLTGAALFIFIAGAFAQTENLAARSQHARELMAQRRFAEAIPIYQDLVAAVPGNPGLVLDLGLAEEMAGQPQKAIPHFQAVLKADPESIPALSSLAMAELQTNRPNAAVAPLEKLVRLQPDNQNARGMLAGGYMSLNQPLKAAGQYRKLTVLDASDPKAWYGLGKAYGALARKSFARLSKGAPQSPYVAVLLADSRLQRKQYHSAFFFYQQAQKQLPDLPGLHTGLAKVYEKTGHPDWAQAERKLELATPCRTRTAECRFRSGDLIGAAKAGKAPSASPAQLFWATRAYNQLARDAFDRLGQMPDSVQTHELKAEILHGQGKDEEAAGEWRAALAIAPHDPSLETGLASSLVLAHDYEKAMPILKDLLAREGSEPNLNFMLGESLWRMQQPSKALPYLTAALKEDPKLLAAHAALGMVYVLLGRNAEAIPHLRKALSLDDDGSIHYALARACRVAGKTEEAKQAMQEYSQIKQRNQKINSKVAKEAEITAPK